MIPYARQSIDEQDIQAVIAVLRSAFLTQGPAIERFEQRVSEHCGVRHAIAVSSATAALHLGCLALDLGPQKTLWTSPNTYVASANSARYCGADVDFIDIEPETGNVSVKALRSKLASASVNGRLPAAIMPVHYSGLPCDLAEIAALAADYNIPIIEDAAHALGATYHNEPVGNCRHSDCAVFSFHAIKIATTGEGGVFVTNRDDLAARIRRLRSHGITRAPSEMTSPPPGEWFYEQIDLGYNYRMTDIQAALGASQMARLPVFLQRRRALARRYGSLLTTFPVRTLPHDPACESSWHFYPIVIERSRCHKPRPAVFAALRAGGIGVNVHFIPVHLQPYYRQLGFKKGDFPAAETRYEDSLTLPLHFQLTDAEQDQVVAALDAALQ